MERTIIGYINYKGVNQYTYNEKVIIAEYAEFIFDSIDLSGISMTNIIDGILEYMRNENVKPVSLFADIYSLDVFKYISNIH